MATTNELLVIEAEDGVVGVEELGVEEDLDAVGATVEELHATDLVQDGVGGVVGHVVGGDGRERVTTKGEDTTLEKNLVLLREKG